MDDLHDTGMGHDHHAAPDPATPDHLELRVWLRMLACTAMVEKQLRTRLRERFDTTLARFDLLAQLDRFPEGLVMGELSRRLMVTHGNVTGLIDRLAAENLVERRPVPGDRRVQLVRLTPAGKEVFAAMAPAHREWVAELFRSVPHSDLAAFHAQLGAVKASIQAADGA
ncbi:MAG TPA: MarR family transcriptional regulator [Azospirillum sp.]|nr:MarR family transcriptional regulator [Azospirillum sp.]